MWFRRGLGAGVLAGTSLLFSQGLKAKETKPHRPPLRLPTLEEVKAAQATLAVQGCAIRTPLLRFQYPDDDEQFPGREIYLKLENLQPIGSFKLRGAGNAIANSVKTGQGGELGVVTASAGNMAQGVAWNAKQLGIPCSVVVPDHAPKAKLDAIARLGATVTKVPFSRWWEIIETHECPLPGHFIHPVCNSDVLAGNGTIALEILEDLPDVDVVVVPYGGGALSCGIASTLKTIKPDTKVLAVEVATAAPLCAAFEAGHPVPVTYTPSFVDGIGGKTVLDEMWPLALQVLDGSEVVTLSETARAIQLMVERNRVVAEGAGGAALAAALKQAKGQKVVAVISGGGINTEALIACLQGKVPEGH